MAFSFPETDIYSLLDALTCSITAWIQWDLTNIKAYITFKSSMDISPQNSYFNYFTTKKKKKNTRRGRRREHNNNNNLCDGIVWEWTVCQPFMHICCLCLQGRWLFHPGDESSRFLWNSVNIAHFQTVPSHNKQDKHNLKTNYEATK